MTFLNNNIPFSIDNYSLALCDDDYLIEHFNDLSPEDQQTTLTFLHYMEELKNSANDHKPTQPRMPPISIGGGIGEQRGENKRILFTLN